MAERRKLIRSRVLESAKLVLGTSSLIDCFVRNLTASGVRVQISHTTDLPERLTLTFDGGRTLRSCRVAWRTFNETGLEFTR